MLRKAMHVTSAMRVAKRPAPVIFDIISSHSYRDPDHPAILASGSEALSFKDLIACVEKIWETLREGGVRHGARIGIVLPSGPESAITTVAIASHATCVPLNPRLSQSEFERELSRLDLDALVVPAWLQSAAHVAAEGSLFGLFGASKVTGALSGFGLQCLRSVQGNRERPSDPSTDTAALILRTSATTGPAKLVPVTQGNLLDLAGKMSGWFGLSTEDRAACVLPTYYAAGSKLNVLVPLLLGECIALPVGVRPERLADWICDLQPTWFSAGPTFLQAVLDDLKSRRESPPKHRLRFITSGSAHLPARVRTELEAILRCPILEVYGISEFGVMAANPAPPAKRKPGTAGLIAPGELVIRGPTGTTLSAGEMGEIFVRGPGLMPGYLGEDRQVGAGLQNGWMPTGDIGSVDSDGFLTVLGRIKQVINRGGEKISPEDVELALMLHDSVREAAAFGVPHPRLGENVAAAVILEPEATTTPIQLRDFLRSRLAPFKIPQRIDIVPSLPKSHNGKVLRRELADAAANRERQIDRPEHPLEFQIKDIWQRLLQHSDFGIHDDFFEAGGDSLLATQMLLEVEEIIGRRVSPSALAQASTIRQLATIATADVAGDDNELVTKVRDGTGTPLFFCHGDFVTRGFYALKLASMLNVGQPVYLIHPRSDVDDTSDLVIEEMARQHVPRLLDLHPQGKFRLGGFCNGGLLAWEIAHQLRKAGRDVELVTLVDCLSLNSRLGFRVLRHLVAGMAAIIPANALGGRLRRNGMRAAWNVSRRSGGSKYGWIAEAIPPLYRRIMPRDQAAAASESPFDKYGASYLRAMANYLPPKLDCEIFAIVCEYNAEVFEWSVVPWTRLAPKVHRSVVPGGHKSCITTHVESLAKTLNAGTVKNPVS